VRLPDYALCLKWPFADFAFPVTVNGAFQHCEPRRSSPGKVTRLQAADILLGGGANPATFKLPSANSLRDFSCTTPMFSRPKRSEAFARKWRSHAQKAARSLGSAGIYC